jgi:branched-chain amino acid transport system ATP-binding protein
MMVPIIEARGVSAGYGASEVLRGIDFTVHAGETIGLMGRNGMGKTTLIRTLLGLLPAQSGSALANGTSNAC